MQIDLTEIIVALIGVLATVVTGYVIPLLRTKVGNEKWAQLLKIADVAVNAAEQLGIAGTIENKMEYAFAQVKLALAKQHLVYDDDTIRAAIESIVLPFNYQETVFTADEIIKLSEAGIITEEVKQNE